MAALTNFDETHQLPLMTGSKFVHHNRPVSKDSTFGEPYWNMESIVTIRGVPKSAKSFYFPSIPGYPERFALGLAEFSYARLHGTADEEQRDSKWATVFAYLSPLRTFTYFCDRLGIRNFSDVKPEHYNLYLRYIRSRPDGAARSEGSTRFHIEAIYRLWECRFRMTSALAHMPFNKPLNKKFPGGHGQDRDENKTPAIPEPVYEAIMSVAMDYVLVYSSTILKIWRIAKDNFESVRECKPTKQAAVDRWNSAVARSMRTTESPWRTKHWRGVADLHRELHMLKRACMLVILAYSGVRPSELLSTEAGCVTTDILEDGRTRYYLNTILHKHRAGGVRDTWVIIEPVVEAIRILETLTEHIRSATNNNLLFITDGSNRGFNLFIKFKAENFREITRTTLIFHMRVFRDSCGKILNRPIPQWENDDGEVKPWPFTSAQFRRTLAQYIVRRPFGVVAGKIQYKHIAATIFEGYAGTEHAWEKELSDEHVLASIDIIDEISIDMSSGQLGGALGEELTRRFEAEFKGRAEDFPPSQIAKWLSSEEMPFYVGKLNFCRFNSTKALCTSAGSPAPILNQCEPSNCSNACVTKRHKKILNSQLEQAMEFVSFKNLKPFQRAALNQEIAHLKALIARPPDDDEAQNTASMEKD